MELNMKRLICNLQRAKGCKLTGVVSFDDEVNDYLYTNYLEPFLHGEVPSVGDLDYSQFSVEDVQEFKRFLEFSSRLSMDLSNFCNSFAESKPVAKTNRTFC